MLRVLWLVQNHDWAWQQRGCVISLHFQQISLITGYVLSEHLPKKYKSIKTLNKEKSIKSIQVLNP